MPQFFTPGLLTQRMQQPNPGILGATPATPARVAPILASGSKRDSVPIVQRASTVPDLSAHQYQARSPIDAFKTGNPDNALLMLGAGLLGGHSFTDGLSKGIAGYAQARQQDKQDFQTEEQARVSGLVNTAQLQQGQDRQDFEQKQYAEGEPLRKLEVEKAKQDIAAGKYQYHDGVVTNVMTGESTVDPAVMEAYRQEQAAKAKYNPDVHKQFGETYWARSNGHTYREINDPNDGSIKIKDITTNSFVDAPPPDAKRVEQYGTYDEKNNSAGSEGIYGEAQDASAHLIELKTLRASAESGKIGDPTWYGDFARSLAQTTGFQIDNVDLTDVGVVKSLLNKSILATSQELLRGGGSISNYERDMAKQAAGDPFHMTAEARKVVFDLQERLLNLKMQRAEDYSKLETKPGNVSQWRYEWARDHQKAAEADNADIVTKGLAIINGK